MLFNINATLPVFVVSFLIFMWLLNEIMLKPVGAAIAKRSELIEKNLEASKESRGTAEQLLERYEADLKHIRSEAQSVISKATDEANKARNAELDRVAKDGQAKLEKAKAEIAAEREKLIDALVAEEKELVESITQKVLGDESVRVSMDDSQVRRTLKEI